MAKAIGSAIIAALAAAAIAVPPTIAGVSTAAIIGEAVIIATTVGLSYALNALNAPSVPSPEAGHQSIKQAIPPRNWVYGRARPSSYYMLYVSANGQSYDELALCEGPICSIAQWYLTDDPVTLDGGGNVVSSIPNDGRYVGSSSDYADPNDTGFLGLF